MDDMTIFFNLHDASNFYELFFITHSSCTSNISVFTLILFFGVSRPGGKYGPPVKIEAAKVIGGSNSGHRGGAGQGAGQGGGGQGGAGQGQGGGEGEGGGVQEGVCVREDLERASQVLATAFKVLTHSLYCAPTLLTLLLLSLFLSSLIAFIIFTMIINIYD